MYQHLLPPGEKKFKANLFVKGFCGEFFYHKRILSYSFIYVFCRSGRVSIVFLHSIVGHLNKDGRNIIKQLEKLMYIAYKVLIKFVSLKTKARTYLRASIEVEGYMNSLCTC